MKLNFSQGLGLILAAGLLASTASAQVLINEFDTNTSAAEYIELYNAGGSPVDLGAGNYALIFINGNGDLIYQSTALTGTIPAGGFFLIAESGVATVNGATVDLNATWTSFQNSDANGNDGFALIQGTVGNYTNGSAYSAVKGSDVQVDAVAYGTVVDAGIDTELGLSGVVLPNGSAGSTERIADGQGGAAYSLSDWQIDARTPRATNAAVILPTTVANIAAARALVTGTEVIISGVVTATTNENGLNTGRNQFYVQDGSGADGQTGILVDDASNTITAAIVAGNTLTNLQGTLGSFSGVLQLVPTVDVTPGVGTVPAPLVVTDAINDFETIESELITLNSVTITGTGNFDSGATGANYAISESPETIFVELRLEEGSLLVGQPVPGTAATVTGLAGEFNGTYQILPRLAGDVVAGSSVSNWMAHE